MNQIEKIFTIPAWDWSENSKVEMIDMTEIVESATDFMWRVGNVAVVGFIHHTLLSPPWMWFLLNKDISVGDLLDFRRLTNMIPSGTLTGIKLGFVKGERFAELYGFVPTDVICEQGDLQYQVYRKK